MAEIELVGVQKDYGRGRRAVRAVHDLSYTIADGDFVSLLGPSGCGKSTTLNMIAGLEDITGGEILIDGHRVDDLDPAERDLAFVFQDYALYPHMDVRDNIGFGLRMRKVGKEETERRVVDAARRLDIEHVLGNRPRNLSGGQRQRVALARAIARRPKVFLFDEPLSNLDALLRDQTRSELKLLHAELGATSVYVTHDQEEAMTLSDRIVVMSRGRLEQYGTPYDIYHRPASQFVASFVGKPRMNLLPATRTGRGRYAVGGSSFEVDVSGLDADRITLGLRPEECSIQVVADGGPATGVVKVVEPLGNASDVTLDLGSCLFVVRIPGFSQLSVGDRISLGAERATLHCFDAETGSRLVAADTARP
ncbi:ABC transporter ATP-binding protein [Auraticoccus monumenti]|uniref:Carbohydrate ABC transporter ATP-binding protein, CUT1 family n=1 Tax=Auraticoccus monumenti TaxID=675864 RepID=A0A1G6VYH2_9ACTN|nr:sn-glycerol-3-phosphate ABC transporter ATP-binding protein UgpC [Auraticoccus monumenti]SDD58483.1 carbohydrate ABC transporter ATP-binding protein, CUT1 family [Auraticoccus monumenti]